MVVMEEGNIKIVEATTLAISILRPSSTLETGADGHKDYKSQENYNTEHHQFDLHILDPHFSLHLRPLLPKILCLQIPYRNTFFQCFWSNEVDKLMYFEAS